MVQRRYDDESKIRSVRRDAPVAGVGSINNYNPYKTAASSPAKKSSPIIKNDNNNNKFNVNNNNNANNNNNNNNVGNGVWSWRDDKGISGVFLW